MRKLLLLSLVAFLVPLAGWATAQEKDGKKAGTKPVVAVFRVPGALPESQAEDPFAGLFGPEPLSFRVFVERLKKAADDSAVKAVVLFAPEAAPGPAQTEELRQVMQRLRDRGKDIYAHADSLSMGSYALLCGASRLSVVPTGDLWITGLYAEAPYVRGLLDLLGVKPDYLTCGDYKSAAEIFMRKGPSPEAERMQNWLLDSLFKTYVGLIAKGRGVDEDRAKEWIDNGPYTADKAREAGLIDAVEHKQDLEALLKNKYGDKVVFNKKYGQKEVKLPDLSSPFAVFKVFGDLLGESKAKKSDKPAIGIVYVEGPIRLGGGGSSPFDIGGAYSSKVRKALDEAANDDAIKAVVLRVDSPGGSATASEIILDATRRVKAKKPFVVSMGNVAGSGGYYVACGSDLIFADASTITGSIGVVGGKFATNDMWNKVGITFKSYQRGKHAGLLSSSHVFTPEERQRIQAWMNEIYETFKKHVTDIRGDRLKKPIDELAGGRVYTGEQALELGLVDKLGTLQDAIRHVADEAKLTDYEVRAVPPAKNFLEQLLEEAAGEKTNSPGLGARLAAAQQAASLADLAMPYLRHLDPQRVQVIRTALQRLQLLQREGAVLMMPEYVLPR